MLMVACCAFFVSNLLTISRFNNSNSCLCGVLHEIIERVLHGVKSPGLLVPHEAHHPFVPGCSCLDSILDRPEYLFVASYRISDTSVRAGSTVSGEGRHVALDLVKAVLEVLKFFLETLKGVLEEGRDLR